MSGIHVVYLVLALIFATFLTYMFVYNIRQNNRQKAFRAGRPPLGNQKSNAAATMEKDYARKTGDIS